MADEKIIYVTNNQVIKDYSKIRYKFFKFQINNATDIQKLDVELDRNIKKVLGIKLSTSRQDLGYYRGLVGLDLDSAEIFPEGFEAKNLIAGSQVPFDLSFATVDKELVAGKLKLKYEDIDNSAAAFVPYTVVVLLRCEIR